ncbi:MAG: diacylglycerol kinase catalytic region [Eubacterium sp.]|jgi:YegS/Rv2252/BmrU family lipid kinase|nr:diacylglycerol kinase catalytic region [Eubacterium sp.]
MKHIFIINPAAGKGKSMELIPFINDCFKAKTDDELVIEVTKYPGHATEIAKAHSGSGECRVYSIGGDGTVNEIVNGIAGTSSALGVIPTGSGNDFIRSLHSETNVKDVIAGTINGIERKIDLAKVNDKYFINISSIGFDANVVFNANLFKKKPGITGSMAYLLSIIYTVFKHKICKIRVDIDGNIIDMDALLVAVANGKFYGGGIMPAPDASLDDGLLDICLVSEVSRLKILHLFPKYIKGQHGVLKEVSFFKGREIRIQSDEDVCLNIDGEIIEAKTIDFQIIQAGIKIIMPV